LKQIMVRYKVKPEQAEKNEELVRAVYDELHRTKPGGLRYATFRLDDGVSFVHLAVETGEDGPSLADMSAFQRFVENVADRCEEAPVATAAQEVGSFRFFGDEA